jgi:chromate reductase, NAD(P)H dehydrogenase (quinone)
MKPLASVYAPRPAELSVLGLCGSLRTGSVNRKLLHAAAALAPNHMTLSIYEGLGALPHYNADIDEPGKSGAGVESLRQEISQSDGILIVTPEYNFSVPGVLKNAIDWASRPARASALWEKPAAIMGASESILGSARAQGALRPVLHSLAMPVLLEPEFFLTHASQRFRGDELGDDMTRDLLRTFMTRFADWIERDQVITDSPQDAA